MKVKIGDIYIANIYNYHLGKNTTWAVVITEYKEGKFKAVPLASKKTLDVDISIQIGKSTLFLTNNIVELYTDDFSITKLGKFDSTILYDIISKSKQFEIHPFHICK